MSLFLAPIHYNVFGKVSYQAGLVKSLLVAYPNADLKDEFERALGPIDGDLANLIDHDNIHGWLQEKIQICEHYLAKTVEGLLDEGLTIEDLEEFFYNQGARLRGIDTGSNLVSTILASFPDGMPCDRAIEPLEMADDRGAWRINTDLHGSFWQDGGGTYYRLRDAWTRGISEANDFELTIDDIYEVKKCTE